VNWQTIVTAVIPAILSGGLLAIPIGVITQELIKPHIQITVMPNDMDKHSSLIKVFNDGRTAATKLSLLIMAPGNISNYNIIGSENFTAAANLTKVSPRLLEVFLNRFEPGEGSILTLDISTNQNPNTDYRAYTAYATYDQGSSKAVAFKQKSFNDQVTDTILVWKFMLVPIGIGSVGAALTFRRLWRLNKIRTVNYVYFDLTIDLAYHEFSRESLYVIRNDITDTYRRGFLSKSQYEKLVEKIGGYIARLLG
jgi:hypothetical protein